MKTAGIYWHKYRARLFISDCISFLIFMLLKIRKGLLRYNDKGIRVLVYHSIKDLPKANDLMRITVPPALFDAQIRYLLARGYKILPIDNILDYLSGNKQITGKEIALTFDDGFEDNLDAAVNTLKKNGLTAIYFLASNHIGSKEIFPWCKDEPLYSKPLSLEETLKLISVNMRIGSHSLNHINMGEITHDRARLLEEIAVSKKALEDKLKVKVDYFAYPYGRRDSYNVMTEDMVRQSGYKAAFTNVFGSNKKGDNLFELKRTRITWNDTPFRFKMKLAGAYDWVDAIE